MVDTVQSQRDTSMGKRNRKSIDEILEHSVRVDEENVAMIRDLCIELGFAISASMELARKPGSQMIEKKVRRQWKAFADRVMEFAYAEG
jgi:3-deoxy-D-manno-octulosonate 8-phosphate phosphatase KdsC-like HAD superfamily phosphatase